MNKIITTTNYRSQELALQWLQKNGGRAKISGGQVALCRALVRKGLARLIRARAPDNGFEVELTEDGWRRCRSSGRPYF